MGGRSLTRTLVHDMDKGSFLLKKPGPPAEARRASIHVQEDLSASPHLRFILEDDDEEEKAAPVLPSSRLKRQQSAGAAPVISVATSDAERRLTSTRVAAEAVAYAEGLARKTAALAVTRPSSENSRLGVSMSGVSVSAAQDAIGASLSAEMSVGMTSSHHLANKEWNWDVEKEKLTGLPYDTETAYATMTRNPFLIERRVRERQSTTFCLQTLPSLGLVQRYQIQKLTQGSMTAISRIAKRHNVERDAFSQSKWERVVALERETFLDRHLLLKDYTEFRQFAGTDDILQFSELRRALNKMLPKYGIYFASWEQAEAMYKIMDDDGQGGITFEEYVQGLAKIKQEMMRADLEKLCRFLDLDHDGRIHKAAIARVCHRESLPRKDTRRILERTDAVFDRVAWKCDTLPFDDFCHVAYMDLEYMAWLKALERRAKTAAKRHRFSSHASFLVAASSARVELDPTKTEREVDSLVGLGKPLGIPLVPLPQGAASPPTPKARPKTAGSPTARRGLGRLTEDDGDGGAGSGRGRTAFTRDRSLRRPPSGRLAPPVGDSELPATKPAAFSHGLPWALDLEGNGSMRAVLGDAQRSRTPEGGMPKVAGPGIQSM